MLTIAHRLETIADNDLIVVLDKGKVAEVANMFDILAVGHFRSYLIRSFIEGTYFSQFPPFYLTYFPKVGPSCATS